MLSFSFLCRHVSAWFLRFHWFAFDVPFVEALAEGKVARAVAERESPLAAPAEILAELDVDGMPMRL